MDDVATEDTPPAEANRRRPWLQWLSSLAIMGLLAWLVADRWSQLPDDSRLPAWPAFVGATVVNMAANVLLADTWRRQVRMAGQDLGLRECLRVWTTSQFARLLFPGATVGARAALGARHGVATGVTVATTIMETVWSLLAQPVVILVTMYWWVQLAPELRLLGLAAIPALGFLVFLMVMPQKALQWSAAALRRVPVIGRRMPSAEQAKDVVIQRRQSADVGGRYVLNSFLRDLSFLWLISTMVALSPTQMAASVGAVAAGRLVGLLAVFAPMGLGPREGITVLVLAPVTGAPVVIVAVAAARFVEMLSEALTWLAARPSRAGRVPRQAT